MSADKLFPQTALLQSYSYTFEAVRLAVPLRWYSTTVLELRDMMNDLPLLVVGWLAFPLALNLRNYRSPGLIERFYSTAMHLMDGNSWKSLITTRKQPFHVLLMCGIISLTLQWPVNLLKGGVVSSTQDNPVQTSNCRISSCSFSGYRGSWFLKERYNVPVGVISRLAEVNVSKTPFANLTNENRISSCLPDAKNIGGGLKNTKLAMLVQYFAICDETSLLDISLRDISEMGLVYERSPKHRGMATMCAETDVAYFHVNYLMLAQLVTKILEHDLVKFPHGSASMHQKNSDETWYWGSTRPHKRWSDPGRVRPVLYSVVENLQKAYVSFNMHSGSQSGRDLTIASIQHWMYAFGAVLCVGAITCSIGTVAAQLRYRVDRRSRP